MRRFLSLVLVFVLMSSLPLSSVQADTARVIWYDDEAARAEATNDSWLSLEADTEYDLVDGREYHIWTQYYGTNAITQEVKGAEVYFNEILMYQCNDFFLDCHIPYKTWFPLLKDDKIDMVIVFHTVYGDSAAPAVLQYRNDAPPLCEQHTWQVNRQKEIFAVCESDPAKHYLQEAYYDRVCTVCGLVQRNEIQQYQEDNSPIKAEHIFGSDGFCLSEGCTGDKKTAVKMFENTKVPYKLAMRLRNTATSGTNKVYTQLAEEQEEYNIENAAGEALKVISNPVGGTYNAFADVIWDAQRKATLERAVVEMLYGVEYGDSTWTKLQGFVDEHGNNITKGNLNMASGIIGNTNTKLSDAVKDMGSSIEYALTATQGADAVPRFDVSELNADYLDDLLKQFADYKDKFPVPEGANKALEYQKVTDDLTELKEMLDKADLNATQKAKVTIDGVSIGMDAFVTTVQITLNHLSAANRIDELNTSENEQLYAIMSDKLQKIDVLDKLMEELRPSSPLYAACEQVRNDIENDLSMLNSTEQRDALKEDGRLITEFSCGTIVTITGSAVGEAVLMHTGISNVVANGITGGSINTAINIDETLENLTFVHEAMRDIDIFDATFYESELYYTLAKKELDYASQYNELIHNGAWFTNKDEKEKLSCEKDIVYAQAVLLDMQNDIRKDFYGKNGMTYEESNRYEAEVITDYFKGKYDFKTGETPIQVYGNLNQISGGKYAEMEPFRLDGWTLEKNTDYEILSNVKDKDGEQYLKVRDTEGNVRYVMKKDVPNADEILGEKYQLYVDPAKNPISVYVYPDDGINDIIYALPWVEKHLGQNGDLAQGSYDIEKMITDNGEQYYQVLDPRGGEWYLKVSDVEKIMQADRAE